MRSFKELAVAFVDAMLAGNQQEARPLAEQMDKNYPDETAMFHLFLDVENALHKTPAHEHNWIDTTVIHYRRRHYMCNCGATKREPR